MKLNHLKKNGNTTLLFISNKGSLKNNQTMDHLKLKVNIYIPPYVMYSFMLITLHLHLI